MEPRTASAGVGGGADPGGVGAAWIRLTGGEGASGARRRRAAVAGVSLMGAAAVSTAVFQTVTGTSTSLAMTPGLGGLFAVSTPTPQGPVVAPTGAGAPTITDLGPTSALPAPPPGPQVDLRAQRAPLPGPGELGGGAVPAAGVPVAGVPAAAVPAAAPVAVGPGGGASGGAGSAQGPGSAPGPGSSWPGTPGVHGPTRTHPTPPSTTTTPPPTTRPTPPTSRPTRPHPPTSWTTRPTPPPRSTTPPRSSPPPASPTAPTPPALPKPSGSGASGSSSTRAGSAS